MKIEAAISRAALPESHVVCGVSLRPFCIGHWLHLNRFDVSFVTGEDHTLGDLLIGVMVCSDTFEGFTASLRSGGLERAMRKWQHRLSGGAAGVWRRRWRALRGHVAEPHELVGFDFRSACRHFETYLAEHGAGLERVNDWSIPVTKAAVRSGGPENPINAPGFMVLFDALTSDLGMAESEALNVGLPWARWRWSIHAERKGWCSLVDVGEANELQREADEYAATIFGKN